MTMMITLSTFFFTRQIVWSGSSRSKMPDDLPEAAGGCTTSTHRAAVHGSLDSEEASGGPGRFEETRRRCSAYLLVPWLATLALAPTLARLSCAAGCRRPTETWCRRCHCSRRVPSPRRRRRAAACLLLPIPTARLSSSWGYGTKH